MATSKRCGHEAADIEILCPRCIFYEAGRQNFIRIFVDAFPDIDVRQVSMQYDKIITDTMNKKEQESVSMRGMQESNDHPGN